jgi:hypothetical protein
VLTSVSPPDFSVIIFAHFDVLDFVEGGVGEVFIVELADERGGFAAGFLSLFDVRQFAGECFHREADDTGETSFESRNHFSVVALRSIGAGFIERVDAGEVGAKLGVGALVEMDSRDFHKSSLGAAANEPAAGIDFVRTPV